MESGTGRAGRDAERLGDLGWRVPEVVVHGEDGPLLGRQPSKAAVEEVPVRDGQQLVGRRRSVDREEPQVRRPATLTRRVSDADVDDEPRQPRIEPVGIAEPAQVTPGDHQRVLQGILGPVDVTEDPVGGREQAVASRTDQVDECHLISPLGRRQELAFHVSGLGWRPLGGRVPTLLARAPRRAFILRPAALTLLGQPR